MAGDSVTHTLRKHLIRMAALLVLGATLTGILLFYTGVDMVEAMLPATRAIVSFLHPEYEFREYRISRESPPEVIKSPEAITFSVFKKRQGNERGVVFGNIQGGTVSTSFTVNGLFVPFMITFSLIIAWPFLTFPRKLWVLFLSLPVLYIITLLDISFCVIGIIEDISSPLTTIAGMRSPLHYFESFFYIFLNTGGRQFFGILIFLLAIAPFHLIRKKARNNNVQPDDRCPCGSGRKFKKCCGR